MANYYWKTMNSLLAIDDNDGSHFTAWFTDPECTIHLAGTDLSTVFSDYTNSMIFLSPGFQPSLSSVTPAVGAFNVDTIDTSALTDNFDMQGYLVIDAYHVIIGNPTVGSLQYFCGAGYNTNDGVTLEHDQDGIVRGVGTWSSYDNIDVGYTQSVVFYNNAVHAGGIITGEFHDGSSCSGSVNCAKFCDDTISNFGASVGFNGNVTGYAYFYGRCSLAAGGFMNINNATLFSADITIANNTDIQWSGTLTIKAAASGVALYGTFQNIDIYFDGDTLNTGNCVLGNPPPNFHPNAGSVIIVSADGSIDLTNICPKSNQIRAGVVFNGGNSTGEATQRQLLPGSLSTDDYYGINKITDNAIGIDLITG